jgi:hypothetical protein
VNNGDTTFILFASKNYIAFSKQLPEDVSQLEDGQSKLGAGKGEEPLTYSVPYSPWTFAGVHFEGPVTMYAVIKALLTI